MFPETGAHPNRNFHHDTKIDLFWATARKIDSHQNRENGTVKVLSPEGTGVSTS